MSNSSVFGLGERGQALFEELSDGSAARDALALEAARLADRLDELDRIIHGDGVLNLMQFRLDFPEGDDEPFVVEVKFQNVLAEARQQALALNQIVQKLGVSESNQPAPATADEGSNVLSLKDLRARAEARKGA
ncbi:hypothetical protein ACN08Y_10315 [Rothia sp. P5764]|uniref:hypothetical protein n=1 Tax=Rothia sp. P5764 TaxID=3402654 RepID=UPI003AC54AF7